MPSTDPEVNSYRTAKQGLVARWMDRRSDSERRLRGLGRHGARAPKTKARLIGELLHTFLYDRQTYFQRAVGDRAWGEHDITRS